MKNDMKKPTVYQENGKWYFFKRKELKNAFDKAREENGQSKLKMISSIAEETDIPEDTIRNHLREDDAATFPRSIEIAKKYGEFFAGDEYAFLACIPTEGTIPEDRHGGEVKAVFGMLYDILACYEESDCFNCIPGTDDLDGAWSYFEGEIGKVKKELESQFLDRHADADYQKLERIINETEVFIKSYSRPGVVKRWRRINPQINFFDCAFEIIEECGMEAARRIYREGLLDYIPSYYTVKVRNDYFATQKLANDKDNLKYSEDRIFQNELLRTLAMVFENDFNNNNEENSQIT